MPVELVVEVYPQVFDMWLPSYLRVVESEWCPWFCSLPGDADQLCFFYVDFDFPFLEPLRDVSVVSLQCVVVVSY